MNRDGQLHQVQRGSADGHPATPGWGNIPVNRLLTTEEVAEVTGLSTYELRRGAKSGRYPALWLGDPSSSFRRLRWNLEVLMAALQEKMERNE